MSKSKYPYVYLRRNKREEKELGIVEIVRDLTEAERVELKRKADESFAKIGIKGCGW